MRSGEVKRSMNVTSAPSSGDQAGVCGKVAAPSASRYVSVCSGSSTPNVARHVEERSPGPERSVERGELGAVRRNERVEGALDEVGVGLGRPVEIA